MSLKGPISQIRSAREYSTIRQVYISLFNFLTKFKIL